MSILRTGVVALLIGVAFLAGSRFGSRSTPSAAKQVLYYQDPMHPGYRSDKPGTAPDCGMALVPVYAGSETAAVGIRVDPDRRRQLGIRLAKVETGGGTHLLRVPGRVAVDTGRLYIVNAATEGYFTSVHANVGDRVRKDQLLSTHFVRELRAAALGHMATLDRLQTAEQDLDPSRPRSERANLGLSLEILRNMGVSDTQIQSIEKTREVPSNIELRAPGEGIVLTRGASLGQRFDRGAELFRIAELSQVWILADLFPEDAAALPAGIRATVRAGAGGPRLIATLSTSVPDVDPVAQTVRARFIAENPGIRLKPDMFVDLEIPLPMPSGITVPLDAILDVGRRTTVFVEAADGGLVPREVETGWRSGGRVQVVRGLKPGETVVVSGRFLLDSETRIQAHP